MKNDQREWFNDGGVMVINWFTKELTLACCDCGLVHRVKILRHFPWFIFGAFQLVFTKDKGMTENLRVEGKDREFN